MIFFLKMMKQSSGLAGLGNFLNEPKIADYCVFALFTFFVCILTAYGFVVSRSPVTTAFCVWTKHHGLLEERSVLVQLVDSVEKSDSLAVQ